MGPIQRADSRQQVVERLIALLTEAADQGCELIVFPELALTTFFPRWHTGKVSDFDHFYETEMPNAATQPLFDEAKRRGIGFSLGYALLEEADDGVVHRWNVQTLVDTSGTIVGTFKKVHIPGHDEFDPSRPFQHAERYFFEPSPDGFGVWDAFGARVGMMICNDRRWPETYREMGLQGVELILCGYNTPIHYVPDPSQDRLQGFHNKLVMQSGAYQNGTFVVGVAKGGVEEGVASLCESIIVAPSGEILAEAATDGDEVIWADLRLDWCKQYTGTLFFFNDSPPTEMRAVHGWFVEGRYRSHEVGSTKMSLANIECRSPKMRGRGFAARKYPGSAASAWPRHFIVFSRVDHKWKCPFA